MALLFFLEEKRDHSSEEQKLDSTQSLIRSTLCKIKNVFSKCTKSVFELKSQNFPQKERAQVPAVFTGFLWDHQKHLQGTGASTSPK